MISIEKTFTQQDFDNFANISGDNNPIHIDPEFSANSGFGKTVAHGILLATNLSNLAYQLVNNGKIIETELMFPAPTFCEIPMIFEAQITSQQANNVSISTRCYERETKTETCTMKIILEVPNA